MVARVQVRELGQQRVLRGEVELPPEPREVHPARRGDVEVHVQELAILLRRDFGKRERRSQLRHGEQRLELVEALAAVGDVILGVGAG